VTRLPVIPALSRDLETVPQSLDSRLRGGPTYRNDAVTGHSSQNSSGSGETFEFFEQLERYFDTLGFGPQPCLVTARAR
jgi:hypothetical protein